MTNQWAGFILMMFYLLHEFKHGFKQSSLSIIQRFGECKKNNTLVQYN